ncbi:DUF3889 domain-containing protein [Cytobacillus purgationiresistens]|uniref:DUF3889 domain-containing protein n=1 Tax=Cytobacillus purgationiresistens TaxID=863449 RepID=A0ABU0ACL4_9BACI|nr:DUF3889 domain-containing protein [Cytobacillus purgationiresistens]MDQ0268996.1 hypothetical protein [Cytobacillus purgationiresistens]
MKKLIIALFALACFGYIYYSPAFANEHVLSEHQEKVDYEKYGRIATAVVKEDYPDEAVVDYKYAGRRKISDTEVIDSFVYEVIENEKAVTVLVKVTHRLDASKFISLTVEEQMKN